MKRALVLLVLLAALVPVPAGIAPRRRGSAAS